MNRRELFGALKKLSVRGGMLNRKNSRAKSDESILEQEEIDTLISVIDTIIPRDHTPGALDAKVHAIILEKLSSDKWTRTVYVRGLKALNNYVMSNHESAFAKQSLTARTRLLNNFAASRDNYGFPFFVLVRTEVFELFYTSAIGQAALQYTLPRDGYPGYDKLDQ